MDRSTHTLACLFAQLGIENSTEDVNKFIRDNKGIPSNVTLAQASIWNNSQSQFITESLQNDSDWSEIVDILDNLLREE